MSVRKKENRTDFILFIIGVIVMLIVLVLILVKGQQVKQEEIMAQVENVEWHNWR